MADLDLGGRVGVVTGGTRGIGLAVAVTLASHGARVVVLSRADTEVAATVAAELQETYGPECLGLACDSSCPNEIRSVYREVRSAFGRLDFLINNAGVLENALVGMITDEMIDRIIAVNASGPIHHLQAAARLMRRSGGGSIVDVSSIIGRVGQTGYVVYGASKAAVIGMTVSAAKELAPAGIRVNAVAPGVIETDMTAALTTDQFAESVDSVKMGRIGSPEEVADVVLFLVSDLSSYVTGQVIGVDGGMTI